MNYLHNICEHTCLSQAPIHWAVRVALLQLKAEPKLAVRERGVQSLVHRHVRVFQPMSMKGHAASKFVRGSNSLPPRIAAGQLFWPSGATRSVS
jgi:hypothetical protein